MAKIKLPNLEKPHGKLTPREKIGFEVFHISILNRRFALVKNTISRPLGTLTRFDTNFLKNA